MKGQPSQLRARTNFIAALETACRIYAPARKMCIFSYESFSETPYQPNVASKIIGLAFLSAVAAWEDFVKEVYLGYLCGYPAPNGYRPKLHSDPAKNKAHALLLAAGESKPAEAERKLRWNSFKWIKSLSEVHFTKESVFLRVTADDILWLDLAQVVRNRVAHNSNKAKQQYKSTLNQLMRQPLNTPLPRGFALGKFLICTIGNERQFKSLQSDEHHWGDIFEGYISFWIRLAYLLCPGDNN